MSADGLEGLAVADFNGDGELDIAVAAGTGGSIVMLLGKGGGFFETPFYFAAGPAFAK